MMPLDAPGSIARSSAAAAATSAEDADVPVTDVGPPPGLEGGDVGARRGEERVRAVVRGRVELVGAVGVRDADDAAVTGRVGRRARAVVAGRGDDDDVVVPRVVDRRLERGAVARDC